MIGIALLLLAIGLSLVITRTAAVMLELTGMSRDSARFQARAAYCGVGYASPESEAIIEHPIRRRIISFLMMLGNAGTATVVATLILSFARNSEDSHIPAKLVVIAIGLVALFLAARSKFVDRQMTSLVQYACKRYTRLDLNDYVALLNMSEGFSILEVDVNQGDWLGGQELSRLALPQEGVIVLGIRKPDGQYEGTPTGTTKVEVGDTLTVYGKLARLEELNRRKHGPAGVYAHQAAIHDRAQEEQQVPG